MSRKTERNLLNKERRKKTMFQRNFSIVALLLIAMLAFVGCGSSGSGTASNSGEGKTAKATLAFDFPEGGVGTALLSDATTHILVNVKQWTTSDLNELRVVNTDKALLTKASPTVTIDLLPTYTRICASQFKGDPNDYVTSKTLETACTFGKLNPGSNTVNLTMLRGTWTLASPLTTSLGSVKSVALNREVKPDYSYEGDVYDGSPEGFKGPFDFPTQAINNWGSIYQAMFKVGDAWQFLENGGAWYTNFFNAAEPNLLIGGGEEIAPVEIKGDGIGDDDGICEEGERCIKVTGFAIGGFGKATDADNVYRQGKQAINYMGYRVAYNSDMWQQNLNCRYEEGYWNDQSWYECYKPVLVTAETELTIFDKDGNKVTKDFVDKCQLKVTGGNKIEGCAGIETSASGTDGTEASYTHKVNFTDIFKGANICLRDDMLAAKDSSGNIICYNDDYGSWWDGSKYVYDCYDGGTYNTATGRCEMSLETACYGYQQDPNESYNSDTQTCTETETWYLNVVTFNPTPVTLTGVGNLPSSMGLTTSNVKNTLEW